MESGKWKMENGKWKMESGKCLPNCGEMLLKRGFQKESEYNNEFYELASITLYMIEQTAIN